MLPVKRRVSFWPGHVLGLGKAAVVRRQDEADDSARIDYCLAGEITVHQERPQLA